jgi:phospholipid/cholesterol/gamma-HCH transport system substrate-binding protein
MRYEVKIGLLTIVAIAMSLWGYKFIQGSNLFSSSNYYMVDYESVGGLTVGTSVQISGVAVGSVSKIFLNQSRDNIVEVTLDVQDEINVPKSAMAYIKADGVLGGKVIDLQFKKPCMGTGDCAVSGDIIGGAEMGMLASFMGGDPEADPMADIKAQISGVVDSLKYELFDPSSKNPIARSTQDLALTMEHLEGSTAQLQSILNRNSGKINTSMSNLAELTNTLASKQLAIANIIDNAENLSESLTKIELDKTMSEVQAIIQKLQGTLGEADKALGGVATLVSDVQAGKGTLGKLMTDDAIYERLNRASLAADTLFTDLQERPYRYVPFKSRKKVLKFDRKDKELREEN